MRLQTEASDLTLHLQLYFTNCFRLFLCSAITLASPSSCSCSEVITVVLVIGSVWFLLPVQPVVSLLLMILL